MGLSRPALSCDGDYFTAPRPDYRAISKKQQQVWLAKAKAYADSCTAVSGSTGFIDHLKTTDTVKDMDTLRIALGQEKLNFYGFSYGTYLGQVYSTLYPDRVRRMVFDGIVDPTRVWYDANLDQDAAFDQSIKVFFQWVADHNSTYALGTSEAAVEKQYYAVLNQLSKTPAGGKLGGDEWTDVFVQAGYYVFDWAEIASAFAGYVNHGDWQTVLNRYQAGNPTGQGKDNGYAMYLATQCTDTAWPTNYNKWWVDNFATAQKAPFETWANMWFNAPCLFWSGQHAAAQVTVSGPTVPPLLFISETKDAATPFSGALKARSLFPRSTLIEGVGGTTHAGSLNGVACTDDIIAAYLADGTLPARQAGVRSDVECPPVPAPDADDPGGLSASAASGSSAAARLAKDMAALGSASPVGSSLPAPWRATTLRTGSKTPREAASAPKATNPLLDRRALARYIGQR